MKFLPVLRVPLFFLYLASTSISAQDYQPAIVIHGGAGTIEKGMLTEEAEKEIRSILQLALDTGYAILNRGESSLKAVEAAIVILEDSPWFNAGKGAVMNAHGNHELDASIMVGSDLKAGAVAGVSTIKNPIRAAIAVMENTPHVLLAGEGAENLAKQEGLDTVPNDYFTIPRIQNIFNQIKNSRGNSQELKPSKYGTVGAVALDRSGTITAGTSTGGMMMKQYNRIGDSPIIGAGTYANNLTCGVSCTGHGEYFIRVAVAKEISAQMEFGGKSLESAVEFTVHERLSGMDASGGVIALDREGNIEMEFNTPGMYRGYKKSSESVILIYGEN